MIRKINLICVVFSLFWVTSSCFGQNVISYDESHKIIGLKENVTVMRDDRSIPYIDAKNETDLYFAQGFETARDRLWQMDLMRRVARGQLSELFGKRALNEDKRWRRYGFSKIADESMKELSPSLKVALESYARGVNAYIATLEKDDLPSEFILLQYQPSEWKATDTIVIGKILADALSTTWWMDVGRANLQKRVSKEKFDKLMRKVTKYDIVLFGKDSEKVRSKSASANFDYDLDDFVTKSKNVRKTSLERIGLYAERLAASNNWVISGKRTLDGKAILANDPHLLATAPGIWHMVHLSVANMRVAGVTIPGVPGVVLGHNQNIAWGATNVGPDVQDVYLEEFNDKGEYKTSDGWKKPKIRKEIIKVRTSLAKPETKDEEYEVFETKNGVIINDDPKQRMSLKWTALNPLNQEFEAFIQLNKAKDWDEFKTALKSYGGASQNFVYADVKGNIGWHVAGKIPIRRKGLGEVPYDGSSNDGDWIGYIPFEELPNLFNPPSGFIVTANQRIVGTDYKYQQLTRQFAAPWRAKRIYELINANKKITMNDVNDIQHDVYNFPLSNFAREIVKRKSASAETLKILQGWDGKMKADSIGATIANGINACVGSKVSNANGKAGSWRVQQAILPWAIPQNDKSWLPKGFSDWNSLLKACDVETRNSFKKNKNLGEDSSNWKWGNYNSASFQHPLSIVPFIGAKYKVSYRNVDGSGQTPNVGKNVSMRLIAKPANWDETRHVIPLGQSGDPSSKNWKDQFESWRTGKPMIFPFSKKAVMNAKNKAILLKP